MRWEVAENQLDRRKEGKKEKKRTKVGEGRKHRGQREP